MGQPRSGRRGRGDRPRPVHRRRCRVCGTRHRRSRGGPARASRGAHPNPAAARPPRAARSADRPDAQSGRARAARRAHGARQPAAVAVQARPRGHPEATEGRADGPHAQGSGTARRCRLAAVGQRRPAGTTLRKDGSAGLGRRSRGDRQTGPRAAAAVEAGRGRTARAGRSVVEPLQDRARCRVVPVRSVLCGAGRGARRQPGSKDSRLSERAEALADSTSWIQTADEIKKLQAEWKTIGPVTRGQEKAIWERFRTACDRFFTRRHADLAERKTMWAENLAKKEALCVAAEALSASTDWDATAAEIKRLQNEWKGIGPVKKTRSEALWQRFRGACDQFFQRYAQRHDIALGERVAAREAICAELEALAPAAASTASESTTAGTPESAISDQQSAIPSEPPVDLVAKVRALRGRWQQEIAARGVDRDRAAALDARFAAAFSGVLTRWPAVFAGSDLDPDANRRKMEALVAPDGRARRLAGGRRGRRRGGAVADDQARGDAERGAGRQHHRRQGGRREQGPSGQRGSASGAGQLDADRAGAGRGPASARRSFPARAAQDRRRDCSQRRARSAY